MHKTNGLYQGTGEEVWNSGAMGRSPWDVRSKKEEGHFEIVRRGSDWERKEVDIVLTI